MILTKQKFVLPFFDIQKVRYAMTLKLVVLYDPLKTTLFVSGVLV
jgi:hypothetical protein